MALTPIEMLRATVAMNRGADSLLHSHNLRSHEQRYLADLALIQALAPAGEILEIGAPPCLSGTTASPARCSAKPSNTCVSIRPLC